MKKSTPVPAPAPDFFSAQVAQASRFYLNLKPSAKAALTIICGGSERCAPDYAIHRGTFPFYSIEYLAQGGGRLNIQRQEYRLQPGMVFSYGPGVPHNITTQPGEPLVKYFIDFAGLEAVRLLGVARLKPGTVAQIYPPGEIQPLFDELIRNGRRDTAGAPEICTQLLRGLALKIAEARAPLPGYDTLAFATYQQCLAHFRRHFLRLRSVTQAAGECHVDDAYLCRLFQRYDHQTPYRLLIRLKMNYAAERLQTPNVLVKQVAEETGFLNPFHFSRVFKSVFGMPRPRGW
jgi:AraC-like DNA-binding protein